MYPVIHLGPAAIQSSGLALLIGLWLGTLVAERECRRRGLDGELAWNAIAVLLVVTVVAARIAYVAQHPTAYSQDPLQVLAFSPSTLSLEFGGFVGVIAALAYIQRRKIPPARFLDALAPGGLVLLALAAIGQFLSGDAYGAPANLPWAIFLWGDWRHPVQLYDVLAAVSGLLLVWAMRSRAPREGLAFLLAVAWYSAARVFIEAFRGDVTVLPGGYRSIQVIAWIVLLGSLWMMGQRLFAYEGK